VGCCGGLISHTLRFGLGQRPEEATRPSRRPVTWPAIMSDPACSNSVRVGERGAVLPRSNGILLLYDAFSPRRSLSRGAMPIETCRRRGSEPEPVDVVAVLTQQITTAIRQRRSRLSLRPHPNTGRCAGPMRRSGDRRGIPAARNQPTRIGGQSTTAERRRGSSCQSRAPRWLPRHMPQIVLS